jgi:hypothetical protein
VTDGNAIDQDLADLVALAGELDVREIAVDRWGAVGFVTRLQEHGLPVAQFGQGFASMSAPCKEIERAILGRQSRSGSDPILRWNIANVRVEPGTAQSGFRSGADMPVVGGNYGAVARRHTPITASSFEQSHGRSASAQLDLRT